MTFKPFKRTLQVLSVAMAATLGTHTAQAATAADTTARTQYPIVLAHGMLGYDDLFGANHFYRIPEALRAAGATVYIASMSAVNDDATRGEQLVRQLRQWAAAGGHTRFNLIGHSQGGTTSRYVAGTVPTLVASVTTIGTPHTVSGTGNVANLLELGQANPDLFDTLANLVTWLTGHPDNPNDTRAAIAEYSDQLAAFNQRFPDGRPSSACGSGEVSVRGVRYYSATGNAIKTNAWDPVDLLHADDPATASDGFMPVCDTHWGQVIRDTYPWNHFDEINELFGLIGKGAPDPTSFYVQQANRLKLLGL